MITTELYNGQGLGNQLWCYAVIRCVAKLRGFNFGIQSQHKYKGSEFLEIDMGMKVVGGNGPEGGPPHTLPNEINFYYREKGHTHPRTKIFIGKLDENILKIRDNTKIDGVMQSINYIQDFRDDLKEWIKPKTSHNITEWSDKDICVILVRGGDFLGSSAFLLNEYYARGMKKMLQKNSRIKFVAVTDDPLYCSNVCPGVPIVGGSTTQLKDNLKASHHIGGPTWMDWTILYNAKNVIISASSFSFWPIWLNDNVNVIAPMYWGDYKGSDGYWSCGDSLIPNWNYAHRDGNFYTYEQCLQQKLDYENQNKDYWK